MYGLHYLDIFSISIYFLVVIAIGIISKRRVKNAEDYFMGGRGFGKLVSIFLAFGSGTSSDTAISTSRETYRAGMSGIWIQLLWLFITPFYWIIAPWYRRLRVITGGDYFQDRFGSKTLTAVGKTVEIVTAKPDTELSITEKNNVALNSEYNDL